MSMPINGTKHSLVKENQVCLNEGPALSQWEIITNIFSRAFSKAPAIGRSIYHKVKLTYLIKFFISHF